MTIKEKIYRKIGEYRFEKEYKKYSPEQKKFSSFLSASHDFVFLMPSEEYALREAVNIAAYFKVHRKNVTLILPEHFVNLISARVDYRFIPFSLADVNPDGLPGENFTAKFKSNVYDVFFDLNYLESLFTDAIAMRTNAKFKIALFKKEKEKIFNLLLNEPPANNLEKSFRNLLNSIRMF